MNLKHHIVRCCAEEDGTVTVDWVVLSAAAVAVVIVVAGLFGTQMWTPRPSLTSTLGAETAGPAASQPGR